MVLYLIGLGLADENDITLKGLELIKKSDTVYLESYTSVMQCSKEQLDKKFDKKSILATREIVESNKILQEAKHKNVALLVAGDPLVATTHVELFLEAKKQGIPVEIINNASIVSAVGRTGLQVYKFGRTISVPFQNATSFLDMIVANKKIGLHTLLLLDLDIAGNKYLTIKEAVERIETLDKKILGKTVVGCARIGAKKELIVAGSPQKLKEIDWGKPPYCLIIPGELHFMEEDALKSLS